MNILHKYKVLLFKREIEEMEYPHFKTSGSGLDLIILTTIYFIILITYIATNFTLIYKSKLFHHPKSSRCPVILACALVLSLYIPFKVCQVKFLRILLGSASK